MSVNLGVWADATLRNGWALGICEFRHNPGEINEERRAWKFGQREKETRDEWIEIEIFEEDNLWRVYSEPEKKIGVK